MSRLAACLPLNFPTFLSMFFINPQYLISMFTHRFHTQIMQNGCHYPYHFPYNSNFLFCEIYLWACQWRLMSAQKQNGVSGIVTRNQNRAVFLARHNYISIMQMSLVLAVKGLLECVIEKAKDCLASKCRGMRRLDANQNGGPRVPRAC